MSAATATSRSWQEIEVSVLLDETGHLGHVIHFGQRWYAFDATHRSDSSSDFIFVGDYPNESVAREAIEQALATRVNAVASDRVDSSDQAATPGQDDPSANQVGAAAFSGVAYRQAAMVPKAQALYGPQTISSLTHFWEQETIFIQVAVRQGQWAIARRHIREMVTFISGHALINPDPVLVEIDAASRLLGKAIVQRHPARIAESCEQLLMTLSSARVTLKAKAAGRGGR